MSAFERAYEITHRWEKGWSNHPADPGGATMDGITQRVFHAWLRSQGEPLRPVKSITEQEKREIYRRQYWDVVRGERLPPGLDIAVFDFAVNSGPARAIRYLQAVLEVKADGQPGEVTLLAAREAFERGQGPDVVRAYMDARGAFLRGLRTWPVFGKGWDNRLRDVGRRAISAAASAGIANVAAVAPLVYRDRPAGPAEPVTLPEPEAAADKAKTGTLVSLISSLGLGVAAALRELTGLVSGLPLEGRWVLLAMAAVAAGAAFVAYRQWRGVAA